MKAKFNITLPEIKAGDTTVMPGGNIQTEVEFAPAEVRDMYQLQKEVLSELPSIIKTLVVDSCNAYVEAKAQGTEALMKDEDYRKNKEESNRIRESIEALAKRLAQRYENKDSEAVGE